MSELPFSQLPPRIRIDSFIIEFIKPFLEKNGFEFKVGSTTFRKQIKDFRQEIFFKRSVYNYSDQLVRFDIIFLVTDMGYKKWYKSFYDEDLEEQAVFYTSAGHLNGWDKTLMDNCWYDLAKDNNQTIIDAIWNNLQNTAFSFLNAISVKRGSVDLLKNTELYLAPRLFDYCICLGDKVAAMEIVEHFERSVKRANIDIQQKEKFLNNARKEILKNWA
jgi:hypothetical protein